MIDVLRYMYGWIFGLYDFVVYFFEYKEKCNFSGEFCYSLDFYVNICFVKIMLGIKSVVKVVDLVIVWENMEGFYVDWNMFSGYGEW